MKFRLITPEKIAFEDDITQLTVPTTTGEITILPGHVPLISQLGHGEMLVTTSQGEHLFAVAGGFVSVTPQGVDILAESADHADAIDLQRAQEARERAEKLRESAQGELEIAEATAALERAFAQLKVANRKHKHRTKF